jgi:hypothetical protein
MSQWTHFCGCIRYDGLVFNEEAARRFAPNLGDTVDFDDPPEQWDVCDVPCGSEGSIKWLVWTNPQENALARWTVTIFGDLRNYGRYEVIKETIPWLSRIVENKLIRNGIVEVEIESEGTYIFQYDGAAWFTTWTPKEI